MQIQRANDRDPWPNLGPQTGQPIPIDVGIQTTDRGAVWRDKITVQGISSPNLSKHAGHQLFKRGSFYDSVR